ncbi:MAG: (d)CMP kinase [Planctomycetaceae bacterium]
MIVTIDGPAGAGKSSAARELATRLGFQFLDTGAMYRAVTWYCLAQGLDLHDEAAVAQAAEGLDLQLEGDRVLVAGDDVTSEIRTSAVTQASRFAAGNERVRRRLTELQRRFAAGRNVVTEGRDQGTLAFPDAHCKFYLTAHPRERALRRQHELAARGESAEFEQILVQQAQRDERDRRREFGGLKPAPDAIEIDTSELSLPAVVDRLEQLVREKLAETSPAAGPG